MDDQTNASDEVKELKEKVTDLKSKVGSLNDQLARISAQSDLLSKYSNGLFSAGGQANTADLLDVKTIGEL